LPDAGRRILARAAMRIPLLWLRLFRIPRAPARLCFSVRRGTPKPGRDWKTRSS